MVLNRAARIRVAILLVSGAIGCNSDRGYAPPDTVLTDHQVSTDVAISEGEAAASDLASLTNTTDFAGGNFSVQAEPARNGSFDLRASLTTDCTYATGRWSCPPSMEDGLTITRSYAFFDAAGQAMKVRDDLTTALVNFQYSVNGAIFRDTTFSEVVHRAQNVTVSGLLGAETTRRWDGFGTSADTNTHRSALTARTYAGTSIDSLKALVYPQPRTSSSYPLSGATVRVVKYLVTSRGRGTERRSVERRVVTTYNGTATVQIQSGSVSCTLHLDSHKVDGCSG
jgi:hypothetical protein